MCYRIPIMITKSEMSSGSLKTIQEATCPTSIPRAVAASAAERAESDKTVIQFSHQLYRGWIAPVAPQCIRGFYSFTDPILSWLFERMVRVLSQSIQNVREDTGEVTA